MTSVQPERFFGEQELAVFTIADFSERMAAIRAAIQPKLRDLGERLREPIGRLSGQPRFPHVAKHMRRTVNPPPETWVAFGPSARGYKQFCHYAFVISSGGVHARLVVKSEAPDREQMANSLRTATRKLVKQTKALPLRAYYKWDHQNLPELIVNNEDFWHKAAEKLQLREGGFDVGFGYTANELAKLSDAELVRAYEQLTPIYQILTEK